MAFCVKIGSTNNCDCRNIDFLPATKDSTTPHINAMNEGSQAMVIDGTSYKRVQHVGGIEVSSLTGWVELNDRKPGKGITTKEYKVITGEAY